MSQITDFLSQIGQYYRDIEVAKASGNGVNDFNSRPESIADQTSMAVSHPAGPDTEGKVSFLGVDMSTNALLVTVAAVAGLALVKAFK